MAEEGLPIQTGQPLIGKGAGGKTKLLPFGDYETVAASQTDQALGATGATGDYLSGLLIVPATTGAGTVSIKDGAGSSINVFVTGTLADLTPIWLPLGMRSAAGAWSVTTGANVSVIAVGSFT